MAVEGLHRAATKSAGPGPVAMVAANKGLRQEVSYPRAHLTWIAAAADDDPKGLREAGGTRL